MSDRRHPDIFSPREAFAYVLGPDTEFSDRTLETWRQSYGLNAVRLSTTYYYHRRDLDALIERLFRVPEPSSKRLRIGGQ